MTPSLARSSGVVSRSTVIVDYGMGNLRSVQKAFEACGDKALVSAKAEDIRNARRLVLPGVGAFGQAARRLRRLGLYEPIREKINSGAPYLGICLGLQLLFESSEESASQKGLGIFKGRVKRFKVKLKVPHIGWNNVHPKLKCPIFKGTGSKPYFYFVHSYFAVPGNRSIIAGKTEYARSFCSAVWKDKIFATQFHPEKSQRAGLKVIQNFLAVRP